MRYLVTAFGNGLSYMCSPRARHRDFDEEFRLIFDEQEEGE